MSLVTLATEVARKELYENVLRPIFTDIGSGFSLDRPKGLDEIKSPTEKEDFKKSYISQGNEAVSNLAKSLLKIKTNDSLTEDSEGTQEIKINLKEDLNTEVVQDKDSLIKNEESKKVILSQIAILLQDIKTNTKPISFKEKIALKKEDDSDDKDMQELIALLKEKESLSDSDGVTNQGGGVFDLFDSSSDGSGGVGFGGDKKPKTISKKPTKPAKGVLGKASKSFGKIGKGLSKAGSFAVKKAPLIGGVVTAGLETSDYLFNDKEVTAKNIGGSVGTVAGTALGTALGSVAGPLGMMAGAYLGGVAGEWLGSKTGEWLGSDSEEVDKKEIKKQKEDIDLEVKSEINKTKKLEDTEKAIEKVLQNDKLPKATREAYTKQLASIKKAKENLQKTTEQDIVDYSSVKLSEVVKEPSKQDFIKYNPVNKTEPKEIQARKEQTSNKQTNEDFLKVIKEEIRAIKPTTNKAPKEIKRVYKANPPLPLYRVEDKALLILSNEE